MMNSPEGYKKENENKSIQELILNRTTLFNEIVEYEKNHIMNNEPYRDGDIVKPSPKDVYNMNNLYLKEITDLMINKTNPHIQAQNNVNYDENSDYTEEVEEMEGIIERLLGNNGFCIEINSGDTVILNNIDRRIDVSLNKSGNNILCKAEISGKNYIVNEEQLLKIETMIKDKFDVLLSLANRQVMNATIVGSGWDNLIIKNNSILLILSPLAANQEDAKTINSIKQTILNIIMENNELEYSQDELKKFFNHVMSESEEQRIRELNIDDKISKLITPTYQIKFIENVGYVFIGKGYLIMADGTEPTHYFLHYIFDTPEATRTEIIKETSEHNEMH